ncbi:MAG TPA: DciA family protein [Kofleriaceae bacterium]|nr:DciA family protein [Kofleriaceae bacterium]
MGRDRFPRTRAQVSAAQALTTLAAEHGLTDELRAHRVIVEWAEIVGPRIAAVAWPEGLSKGVLWVRVKSSPWLHELNLLRLQLLGELQRAIAAGDGEAGRPPLVAELRFHLRPRPTEDDDLLARLRKAGIIRRPRAKLVAVPAVGPAKAAIEQEADAIEDAELRELVRAVRVRNGR